MLAAAIALLAAAAPPVILGSVSENGRTPVAGAHITLTQGKQRQVVRTRRDGTYRFRPWSGPGTISAVVPAGWTLKDAPIKEFAAPVAGDVVRVDFAAQAHRSLRGRLVVSGQPLAGVDVTAGSRAARTGADGRFSFDDVAAGPLDLRVEGLGLSARAEVPAAPGESEIDVPVAPRTLQDLKLVPVPQDPAVRSVADWAEARPMSPAEASRLEKLCAVANLDAAFRLAIVAPPSEVGEAAGAAVRVQRFLTGPCLVPPARVVFAVAEVASPGRLAVLLARQENR